MFTERFFSNKGHLYIQFKFPFIFSAVINSEHSSVFYIYISTHGLTTKINNTMEQTICILYVLII